MPSGFAPFVPAPDDLQDTIHLLQAVAEAATEALFVKESNGRYRYSNAAGARLLGLSVAEIIRCTDQELFGTAAAHRLQMHERRVIESGRAETSAHTLAVGGRTRVLEVTKTPYRDVDQAVVGIIMTARDITAKASLLALQQCQQTILELITRGESLPAILSALVSMIEAELPGVIGSFLLLDRQGQRLRVACGSSLPEAYNRAIDGVIIGPQMGSCGTAAFRGEPVRVDDIQTDPLWIHFRELADRFGLRACWSIPLLSRQGNQKTVLGTFALYARESGVLDERLHEIIARIEYLACLAIEHHRNLQRLEESENHYRQMLETLPMGVLVHDGQRRLYANPKALQIAGAGSLEEFLKSPLLHNVVPTNRELARQHIEHLLKTGINQPVVESQVVQVNGTVRDVEVSSIRIPYEGRECVQVHFHDITERRQAEAILRDSEARFRLLTDAIPQIVWVAGSDGALTHLNAKATEYTGIGVDQLTGWSWGQAIHPEDLDHTVERWTAILTTGVEEDLEFRIRRRDGAFRWHIARQIAVRDADGGIVCWYGTCTDIEELKRKDRDLLISERRLAEAQRISQIGSWEWEPSTGATWWSEAIYTLYGFHADKVQPSFDTLLSLIHPDDRPVANAGLDAMLTGIEDGFSHDVRLICPDERQIWIHSRGRAMRDEYGRILLVEGIDQNITGRKLIEAALHDSEERLRVALSAASAAAFVWDTKADSLTRYYSTEPALPVNLGKPEKIEAVYNRIHPDDRAQFEARVNSCLARGNEYRNLYRVVRPGGLIRWMEAWGTLERDTDGSPQRLTGISIDITERKQAELALQQSVSRLLATLEATADGILVVDLEGRIVDFNRQFLAIWNMPADLIARGRKEDLVATFNTNEAMQQTLQQLQDPLGFVNRVREIYSTPKESTHDVIEFRDGRIVERISQPQRIDGVPVGRVWSFRDVTVQRKSERELQDRERLLRIATGSARVGLVVVDASYRYLFANEAFAEILDLDFHAIVGSHCSELLPEAWSQIQPALDQAFQGERCGYERMLAPRTPAAEPRWLRAMFEPRDNDAGERTVVVVALDITEQKRTEAAIRESELRFRSVLDFCPAHVFLKDLSGRYLFANRGMADSMKMSQLDWVGRTAAEIFPETIARQIAQNDQLVIETLRPQQIEETVVRFDGTRVELLTILFPLFRGDGKPYALCGIATDITDRKRAEADLRRTAGLLQAVADGTSEAVFVKDRDGKYLLFNEAATRFVGKSVKEVLGHDDTALFDAESARFIMERDRRIMESGVLETEEEVLTVAGVTRTFLATKGPYRDETGNVVGIVGISLDISPRKEAERALKLTKFTVDRAVDSVFWVNPAGEILYVNEAACRTLGYHHDELVGKTVPQIDPNFPQEVWPAHWEELKRRGSFSFESNQVTKDGRLLNTEVTVNYLQYEGREYNCAVLRDITQRKQAEAERDRLWNQSPDLLCTFGFDGRFRQLNPAWTSTLGWSVSELLAGSWIDFVHPDDAESTARIFEQLNRNEPVSSFVNRYRCKTGAYRWLSWNAIPVSSSDISYGFARDITEEKELAEQFRQSQKMEAIGRLAGGVAHDFNNLLTVINGYAELLLTDHSLQTPHRESVVEIREAGDRAAELTAQLLAFSRKSIVASSTIELHGVIESAARLLRRLIGEDIVLSVNHDPQVPSIKGDQGQLEQVLVNLCVNARDAMPNGGRLTIETARLTLHTKQIIDEAELLPGEYASVSVIDTGEGMSDAVQSKIFEPFFTTKDVGKGTGLGLAVVHGIVKQFGGHIRVASAIGVGTTITLLFPAAATPRNLDQPSGGKSGGHGTETILLVEDDAAVRSMARIALENAGFTVLVASSADAALKTIHGHPGEIHLIISDVIMPRMGGRQTVEAVRALLPNLPALFISGYTEDRIASVEDAGSADAFLPKPFTPLAIVRKTREVLDRFRNAR